ncbi:MAG: hypothetical protein JNK82_34615, partial [Myxococcaceae bacterium]|nr:hypothetical protein [Myxococcaceae bacterium]
MSTPTPTLALLFLCACMPSVSPDAGGSAGGAGGAFVAGQPLAPARFCAELAVAVCDRAEACGWLQPAQRAACERTERATCNEPGNFGAAVRGLVAYDALQARACVDAQRGFACALSATTLNPDCTRVVGADAGVGEVCSTTSRSCQRGLTCAEPQPGTCACVASALEGQDCSQVPCSGTLMCIADGGSPRCVARLPDEAPCSTALDCASIACVTRDDGSLRCGALPAGESCAPHNERPCASDLYCRGFRNAESGDLLAA